jgi:hypothetical protein
MRNYVTATPGELRDRRHQSGTAITNYLRLAAHCHNDVHHCLGTASPEWSR